MLHAGLDLSRKRLDVCVLAEDGERVEVGVALPEAGGLAELVDRVRERYGPQPVRAAVESMNGARFVHDRLERLGWEVEVADAGPGSETPLHWAASSDDVDVAVALIDGGADLETPNGSIGTPLDNAVGYGCWNVARLLVARGARVEKAWHAGALGMLARLDELLAPGIDPRLVSQGFWHACAAGQRRAAERLLSAGADLNWQPDYAEGTALDAATGRGTQRENVIEWLRSLGAGSTQTPEQEPG